MNDKSDEESQVNTPTGPGPATTRGAKSIIPSIGRSLSCEANTDWFKDAKWGAFMHFLADTASAQTAAALTPDEWNRRVDAFDVERLATDLADAGVRYFFLTIGQNSGFYCSPNKTFADIVDRKPSRFSERDLILDMAAALKPHGIRMMAYFNSHAPSHDRQAIKNLRCTPPWDCGAWSFKPDAYSKEDAGKTDARLTEFQTMWESIVREWSVRWAGDVHGWWIDGCYFSDKMYNASEAPNYASFAAALKAGNPASIVAFNSGCNVPVVCLTQYEDYTAGEADRGLPVADAWGPIPCAPVKRFVKGAQYHILTFQGDWWGQGTPRFNDELFVGFTRHINAQQGGVTWDVPHKDGVIGPAALRQLGKLHHL
jgi:hypothetical protein